MWNQLKHRLSKPVVAYVILALATGYSVAAERQHSNDNKTRAVQTVALVLKENCESGNQLRLSLQEIVRNNLPQIRKLERTGVLTPAQARDQTRLTYDALTKLNPVDCTRRIAPLVKVAK